ncbi:signal transducer and activator of transcription 1-alpha/beta-like isoform X2 [Notolabrus celidotus]|uniref:signal transducer and activator of transcription 1-alpha/beta-like isoform X2 n=1 Tax=Notolabrus celidotus TaxID=1203425 RepID=UPI0014901B98|nr:signal transducer and activator of transcription 1-alpha/beta-like isoform X2 [Notolabrus celidotus]
MAQWQDLLKLDSALQGQVRQLYESYKFPREIRHYLCLPIESQDWDFAAQDEYFARTCLQALLRSLEEQWVRTVQQNSILLGPDFPAMKDYLLKTFENHPVNLAVILSECLKEEKKILASASEAQGCSSPTVEQKRRMLDIKINDVRRQTLEVKQETKSLEGLYEKLDFIRKNWQSRVEEHAGFPQPQAVVEEECLIQANIIMQTNQTVQKQIVKILNQTKQIVATLVDVELPEWKQRQQLACIGSPVDTSLDYLEKWFMAVAEVLLQIRKQLQKLQDLITKYNRTDASSLPGPMQEIERFALSLLEKLLSNALVVQQQPVMMSQPQRPLIIKTGVRFSVTVRFLANLTEFVQKCLLKVTPVFDKDVEETKTLKGFRQFDIVSSDYKVMDVYPGGGGLEAEFGHMLLKEKKGNSKGAQETNASDRPASKRKRNQSEEDQNHLSVTEELHVIKFVLKFQHGGLDLSIETSSLPLVVISSTNQIPAAWATIMWFNMLSNSEAKDLSLFLKPPSLTWEQLALVLSWQFLAVGEMELNPDQLCALRDKFVGPDGLVHWKDFSKIESSAWFWIDGILDLIRKHLLDLWRDGSIMGFVSRKRTEALLKEKQAGTFLIRFSESNKDGAITFSWVDKSNSETHVHAVDPYTKQELSVNSLPYILYNYSLKAQANTNRKPLLYLYPDIPKDTAFGRYYTVPEKAPPKNGKNGYVLKKFIPVSSNPTPPPSPTRELEMMETDSDHHLNMGHQQVIQELFPDIFCHTPGHPELFTVNQEILCLQDDSEYPFSQD